MKKEYLKKMFLIVLFFSLFFNFPGYVNGGYEEDPVLKALIEGEEQQKVDTLIEQQNKITEDEEIKKYIENGGLEEDYHQEKITEAKKYEKVGNFDCSDYYDKTKISLEAEIEDSTQVKSGHSFDVKIRIKNNLKIALTNIFIVGETYRIERSSENKNLNGDYKIGDQVTDNNIYLSSGEIKDFEVSFNIPNNLIKGDYYFIVKIGQQQKILLEKEVVSRSNLENRYIYRQEEENVSNNNAFYIEKNRVYINDKLININKTNSLKSKENLKISIPIINKYQKEKNVYAQFILYKNNSFYEENEVSLEKQTVSFLGEDEKIINYQFSIEEEASYILKVIIKNSILDIDLNFESGGEGLIENFGLSSFPIEEQKESYIYACFKNDNSNYNEGSFKLELIDQNTNKNLKTVEYKGSFSATTNGYRENILFDENFDNLILKAYVYDKNGELVSQAESLYNCLDLEKSCKESVDNKNLFEKYKSYIIVGGGSLIFIFVLIIIIMRKRNSNNQNNLYFFLTLLIIGSLIFTFFIIDKKGEKISSVKAQEEENITKDEIEVSGNLNWSYSIYEGMGPCD